MVGHALDHNMQGAVEGVAMWRQIASIALGRVEDNPDLWSRRSSPLWT